MFASTWLKFAVALALGLLIGLERERSKGEGPDRRPAGIRTFALATLLGAVAVHSGGTVLLAIAVGAVAVLAAVSYLRGHDGDPGLTTAIGLLIAPLLGALVMADLLLATSLAVAIAVIFAVKAPLHQFVKGVLTNAEMVDGFIFAIATLVLWPQLPDRYLGPFNALNPHSLWLLVVLVLAIGACGHIAIRAMGARYGLPLVGLASGFVSSVATIGSMGEKVMREPAAMAAAVAGATLSTVATFVQMALLLLVTDKATLQIMTPALVVGGLVAALYALAFTMGALQAHDSPRIGQGRAFSFMTALGLTATLAGVLVATAFLRNWLGEVGVVIAAALVGFADTHSPAISVATLAASGKLAPQATVVPILAAMTANAATKIVMAFSAGSGGFALRIAPGIVLSMAAAWGAAFAMMPR